MLVSLLPLLVLQSDPQVVATGDREVVEQAISRTVHRRVGDGWSLLGIEVGNQQIAITVGRREIYERHVLVFGAPNTYRIEPTTAPIDLDEPSDTMLAALSAPRGGLIVESECGEYYASPYLVEDEATGMFAQSLVARTLATADDLEAVAHRAGRTTFTINHAGTQRALEVWTDPKGTVIEAQVRNFQRSANHTAYPRLAELRRAMRKTRVIAIHGDQIVTTVGKLVIDEVGDGQYEGGCGC